jgi:hypothetical protein
MPAPHPLRSILTAALLLATVPSARAGLIDFETLPNLTTVNNQYTSQGVTFVGSAFYDPADPSNAFSSNTDMRVTRYNGDVAELSNIPSSFGTILHTFSGWLTEINGDSNFAVLFNRPLSRFSIDILDDKIGLTEIYAIRGNSILGVVQSQVFADARPQTLVLDNLGPITAVGVVLGSGNDWVAVDNLRWTEIPEPSAALAIGLSATLLTRRAAVRT